MINIEVTPKKPSIEIGSTKSDKKNINIDIGGSHSGSPYVLMDTTENWNNRPLFIPEKAQIVAYTDHGKAIKDGELVDVPGVKIGDGKAYLIDLPFVSDDILQPLAAHIANDGIHITEEERQIWNNKLNCSLDGEVLIFNRD